MEPPAADQARCDAGQRMPPANRGQRRVSHTGQRSPNAIIPFSCDRVPLTSAHSSDRRRSANRPPHCGLLLHPPPPPAVSTHGGGRTVPTLRFVRRDGRCKFRPHVQKKLDTYGDGISGTAPFWDYVYSVELSNLADLWGNEKRRKESAQTTGKFFGRRGKKGFIFRTHFSVSTQRGMEKPL